MSRKAWGNNCTPQQSGVSIAFHFPLAGTSSDGGVLHRPASSHLEIQNQFVVGSVYCMARKRAMMHTAVVTYSRNG